VYVPAINWFLLAACLGLVFAFGSTARLAAAYGVAVTLTMVITTVLVGFIAVRSWRWSRARTSLILAPLLVIDLAFAVANVFKIPSGGWFPLVIGLCGFAIFTTWWKGRRLVRNRIERQGLSIDDFVASLAASPPPRHPGTGVYMHRETGLVSPALLTNLRVNESLHDTIVFVSVTVVERPHTHPAERPHVRHHGLGFHEVDMHYGFTDQTTLATDLQNLSLSDINFDPKTTTYFLGRERISATNNPGMARWRQRLFALLARNAGDPAVQFGLPVNRSVDIGTHVSL
jgi:KUP system potassium uptake protein